MPSKVFLRLLSMAGWLLVVTRVEAQVSLPQISNIAAPQQAEIPETPISSKSALNKARKQRLLTLDFLKEESFSSVSGQTIEIKQVQFLGNKAFSQEQLSAVVEPWLGTKATFGDLIDLRSAVTDFYVEHGYITSGAYLPPQTPSGGVVKIQVVEGELEEIDIQGIDNPRTRAYARARVRRLTGSPLNQQGLLEALQLLQNDPLFERVEGNLEIGRSPELNDLELSLTPAPPWQAVFQLNNHQIPNSGALGATVSFANQNLIGFGDRLQAGYLRTEGLDLWNVSYALPFNALDGTFSVGYRENSVAITAEELEELDIAAEASTFFVGVRQPLIRQPSQELALELTFDVRESETRLGGTPFGLDLGTIETEGQSRVRALRFAQEYLNRGENSVVFARSQFSVGLDVFDATDNLVDIDGTFFSWLGQMQYLQRLDEGVVFSTRIAGQLTPNALLPLEQIGIGGARTVRGHEESSRTGDLGVVGSAQVQFQVADLEDEGWGTFTVAPFVDLGAVWNNGIDLEGIDRDVIDPSFLASVGLGLEWEIGDFSVRTDLGLPLGEANDIEQNIFFEFQYRPRFGLF